jgi:Bacteriorhodopsin-like protein.
MVAQRGDATLVWPCTYAIWPSTTEWTMSLLLQMSSLGVEGEGIWLGIGTIGMLLGMVYFMAKGWDVQDPNEEEFYVITILIARIAASSYLSMFFGFGL